MIYNNLEFYNVGELKQNEFNNGVKIYRYPLEVREHLDGYGKREAESCRGCEIRFVTKSENIEVKVVAEEEDGDILVFKGDYFHSIHRVKAGEASIIKLEEPERFSWVSENVLNSSRFSSKVWRIFLDIRYVNSISLCIHNDFARPPHKDEVPKLRWLAYGSSVTYGIGAINNTNCYVQQAARRIGVDVLNLGLAGSCYCEKHVANFIAERDDWDFVTLEIGVNMRNAYSQEEFKNRVNYLLDNLLHNHPNKQVILINIFPNHAIYSKNGSIYEKDHLAFSNILKELLTKKSNKNLHLINGEDILSEFSGLTVDLIHPSDFGHITMGENLAVALKNIMRM